MKLTVPSRSFSSDSYVAETRVPSGPKLVPCSTTDSLPVVAMAAAPASPVIAGA